MEAEASASGSAAAAPTTGEASGAPNPSEEDVMLAAGSEEAKTEGGEDEEEALVARAQRLIDKILETQDNPNPRHLHALATILEAQEAKYLQESTNPPCNNTRASHTIGRLGNLVRDNDEFYESISSNFLSESRYSVSVRAASARLLLSSASSWMYPHVFDDSVLDNVKIWVTEDGIVSNNECIWKHELGANKPTDTDLLRTYATGLLALSMTAGGEVVEDILTSGLSAKLMRYLRIRVLGDTSNQDITFPAETRHSSLRSREENRVRTRQISDTTTRLEGSRIGDEGLLENSSVSLDCDRNIVSMQLHGDGYWGGGDSIKSELTDSSSEAVGVDESVDENADVAGEGWQNRNLLDAKSKHGERLVAAKSTRDEDVEENMRDELSRRRTNRGLPRSSRLKVRTNETMEIERSLASPSGLRLGCNSHGPRDKPEDSKLMVDMKTNSSRPDFDSLFNVEDKDERLSDCIIVSSDISEMVRKAIRAAEAEARTAGAPVEAIKAAGDAAAELVKSAAMEALKSTNDQEAVILAASKAASTVVDAAIATEVSRSANKANEELVIEAKSVEEMEDFTILDTEHVASLREKYSIQCLEILGEYVEALGPILHEKGVDVCLALLQRSIKDESAPDNLAFLPEVLKLICALAAHRKFAALFVDRGGMQKLLSVRRVAQTFFGLSSCLFTIGSLQGIMERVCALPSDVANQIVELGLQLLECPQDQARKNAAIFFAAAFVFRAVLDSFDAQEGLQKMLNLLHGAASVRSGGNSGSLSATTNNTLRNDRSTPEVLTASEKQIAYHTCVALRQYFRAHLLLLVDSLRPNKSSRSVARNAPSARQAYKPLDISNEAMDAVFLQIQRDRKIGPAFVRARWPAVDKFLTSNGHITMLELCQAPPVERYLHDLAQYALGILHLITFVPYSRKLIVNATLSNNRVGMAVILDAANGAGFVGPEVIHPALNLLVNLVCPPPSISNKPSPGTHGQQSVSAQTLGACSENRDRHSERNISGVPSSIQNELQSHSVERGGGTAVSAATSSNPQTPTAMSSGVVGDRRISLGPGAGCAGLAAQLEQGYRQAREAVRANNGIKVILHLLHPRMITPPAALDCIRALACRVLLGLARDDAIAQILTKLQVGKKLSELIRDSGSQASGTEQGRWQSELAQVAIELIAIVTNSGRASTLAATDAAAPTLRRIERAAIAAATPISYHSRELLQLIHEHLHASGFTATAALLQKEADFTPLPSSGAPPLALHQTPVHEMPSVQLHWPSGRASAGFCSNLTKTAAREGEIGGKSDFTPRKKMQALSSSFSHGKYQLSRSSSTIKQSSCLKSPTAHGMEIVSPVCKSTSEVRTPILLPIKRKFTELKEPSSASAAKRLATAETVFQTPVIQVPTFGRRNFSATDPAGLSPIINSSSREAFSRTTLSNMPGNNSDDVNIHRTPGLLTSVSHPGMPGDLQPGNTERMTLDSLVVQYLKHQHRQCPAPITTLPPLSLLHPHVCPEPSHGLNAPANVTARIGTREFRKQYGGIHAHRRDRQFIYSRFRPCRPCRDDTVLLSCITFLGDSSRIATGSHSGDLKIFDTNNGNILESQLCHQTPVTIVKSAFSGGNQLILSSGSYDVKLWDASSISSGPLHSFDVCKAAHFTHSGANFAALSSDIARREVLLYDIQTCKIELRLSDSSNGASNVRGHTPLLIHFNPSDKMILWNGILWDRRSSNAVHRFDQFTDYGGGGFHPSGNEVIINSEVWDLRKFKLLRTVPSLDQTVITFNGTGDIIYAILRRNIEDITSAVNTRRVRHPLFPAFRTIDAVNYSDIATVQVDRCILDLARDPSDSLIGVISMDDHEEMFSSARLYEVGRKRPTDDDSDPDDGGESDEEDDENDDSEADVDPILGADLDGDGDSDSDDMSNEDDDEDVDSADELDEDGDFNLDDVDFDGGQGFLDIIGGLLSLSRSLLSPSHKACHSYRIDQKEMCIMFATKLSSITWSISPLQLNLLPSVPLEGGEEEEEASAGG